jgi:hypothetical protein
MLKVLVPGVLQSVCHSAAKGPVSCTFFTDAIYLFLHLSCPEVLFEALGLSLFALESGTNTGSLHFG